MTWYVLPWLGMVYTMGPPGDPCRTTLQRKSASVQSRGRALGMSDPRHHLAIHPNQTSPVRSSDVREPSREIMEPLHGPEERGFHRRSHAFEVPRTDTTALHIEQSHQGDFPKSVQEPPKPPRSGKLAKLDNKSTTTKVS